MADERYTQLEQYPWDAGVPRDWPQQGYIGPSTYKLPAWRLGADAGSGGSGFLQLLLIGGAVLLFLKLSKKGSGSASGKSSKPTPFGMSYPEGKIRNGQEYELEYAVEGGSNSYAVYYAIGEGDKSYTVRGPSEKIERLPKNTSNLPGVMRKLGLR